MDFGGGLGDKTFRPRPRPPVPRDKRFSAGDGLLRPPCGGGVALVDPAQLSLDIAGNVAGLALPAALWALLFLVAFERGPFADSLGFGRKAFWLLLPGALFASLAIVPIAPVSYDWVGVSLAGALFPLFVGALAVGRYASPRAAAIGLYLLVLLVEAGLLLVWVLPSFQGIDRSFAAALGVTASTGAAWLVLLVAVAVAAVAVGLFGRANSSYPRVVAYLVALTSGVLVATFVATSAIPGVGIVEAFPDYLVTPVAAGVAAALVAPRVFPGKEGFALPSSYLAATFGVLLGADLLQQPPLYGHGAAGLYVIGGAGVFDLVYLSGLLAFAGAYLTHVALGRSLAPVGAPPRESRPTPIGRLGRAFRAGVYGSVGESIQASARAGREAAAQARLLLEVAPGPDDRPWAGLPVPGWVVSDQANLDAVARSGTTDGREGYRAWLMARLLVLVGREVGLRRYGPMRSRTVAFLLDLLVVTAPAGGVFTALTLATPGSLDHLVSTVAFSAALYGYISAAFLYLVLAEALFGTTVGKWLLGLEVRDRTLRIPGGVAALVRNTPLLPILVLVGIGISLGVAFGFKAGASVGIVIAGIALPVGVLAVVSLTAFVVVGVGLLGTIGILMVALTAERQRIGDLWAGTWVVTRGRSAPSPAPAPPPAPPPPSA